MSRRASAPLEPMRGTGKPLTRVGSVLLFSLVSCVSWERSGTHGPYEPCRYGEECAAGLSCTSWNGFGAICAPVCRQSSDCQGLPEEGLTTVMCPPPGLCILLCDGQSARCSAGSECHRYGNGTYGYCSPQ